MKKRVVNILTYTMLIICLTGCINKKEKIDVKGNSYSEVNDIIMKYSGDIDFDTITTGVNCYTGMKTKEIETEKYGKVTVEFAYCKDKRSYIHIFN